MEPRLVDTDDDAIVELITRSPEASGISGSRESINQPICGSIGGLEEFLVFCLRGVPAGGAWLGSGAG